MSSSQQPPRRSVTQSPWYWVYLFCTAGLIGLVLMGPKFGHRQAQIEREYQGRQRADQQRQGQQPSTPMSTSDHTTMQLWPLYLILTIVISVAWAMLWKQHFRRRFDRTQGKQQEQQDPSA